jgi:hypothetical protein
MPVTALQVLLRAAFFGPAFDATWYRSTYSDVATAIAAGHVPDELAHFTRFGYFEGRRPRAFVVDKEWYEQTYRDVAAAIERGSISGAEAHFNADGYLESRVPTPLAASVFGPLLDEAADPAPPPAAAAPEPAPEPVPEPAPSAAPTRAKRMR